MRQAVPDDGVKTRITQENLDDALGGRIFTKDGIDLFPNGSEHGNWMISALRRVQPQPPGHLRTLMSAAGSRRRGHRRFRAPRDRDAHVFLATSQCGGVLFIISE